MSLVQLRQRFAERGQRDAVLAEDPRGDAVLDRRERDEHVLGAHGPVSGLGCCEFERLLQARGDASARAVRAVGRTGSCALERAGPERLLGTTGDLAIAAAVGGGNDETEAQAPDSGATASVKLPPQETADYEQAAMAAGCKVTNAEFEGAGHEEKDFTAADYKTNPRPRARTSPTGTTTASTSRV